MRLVVCHDAGGAEIVAAWIASKGEGDERFVLAGPAREIFIRRLGRIEIGAPWELAGMLGRCDSLLTGTSATARLETEAIRLARRRRIPSAAYLDHWVNYRERFARGWLTVLPDELWVGDEHALRLAQSVFTSRPIRLEPNMYLEEMRDAIVTAQSDEDRRGRVLYVCEPTSREEVGYDEFDALDRFLGHMRNGCEIAVDQLRVRPHPSDWPGKYDRVIAKHRLPVRVSDRTTLAEDCAWADWVIGCDTMAMVVALHAGRKVASCIPPGGQPLSLPYRPIRNLYSNQ